MAGLNLIPTPSVVVVQAGVFFASLYVIKKFFLNPYLKVHEKREKLTKENHVIAEEILATNVEQTSAIDSKIKTATAESKKLFDSVKQDTEREREKIIEEAETEAKKVIEKMRFDVEMDLKTEKQKIPQIISVLTEELYIKVLQ